MTINNWKAILLLFGLIAVASCNKSPDVKKHYFEASFKTWYRVSPVVPPVSTVVNNVNYAGFAHFPGAGTGHNALLGNCTTYFNQLAYGSSPEAPPAGSVGAPVIDIPGYAVTGGPLPLIQEGDFIPLALVVSSLNIPGKIYDQVINQVVYNRQGDAIFLSALTGTGGTFPISQVLVGFNGKGYIAGGRGKYRYAKGEYEFEGYFNVTNANDAEFRMKGWVAY